MRTVLARFAWTDGDGWNPPGLPLGAIDLRSLPQRNAIGGAPQGWGLFVYQNELPAGIEVEVELGDDPLAPLALSRRVALARALELPPAGMPGASLGELLGEVLLGIDADPTGQTRAKPIRMTRRGARVWLQPFGKLWEIRFDQAHPLFEQTLAVRLEDYPVARARALAEAARLGTDPELALDALRRQTDYDSIKYGVDLDRLLPSRFIADGKKPHATTAAETWPSAGDPTSGQDQTWTLDAGTPAVSGGKLTHDSGEDDNRARCTVSLSSDDHYHKADSQHSGIGNVDVMVRATSSDDYRINMRRVGGTNVTRLRQGITTTLATSAVDPGTSEQRLHVEVDGSDLYGERGPEGAPTVTLGPVTDTAITGVLQVMCGFNTIGETHTHDNHVFGDLAAAIVVPPKAHYYRQLATV